MFHDEECQSAAKGLEVAASRRGSSVARVDLGHGRTTRRSRRRTLARGVHGSADDGRGKVQRSRITISGIEQQVCCSSGGAGDARG